MEKITEKILEIPFEFRNLVNFLFDKYIKSIEYKFNQFFIPEEKTELSRINILWKEGNRYDIQLRNTGSYIGEISLTMNGICYCIEEEYKDFFEKAL